MSTPTLSPSFAADTPQEKAVRLKKYRRTFVSFRTLEHALLSDDLRTARDAFARIKEDSPPLAEVLSHDPFPEDNDRVRAFKDLGRCLLAGDLKGAKQAAQQFL